MVMVPVGETIPVAAVVAVSATDHAQITPATHLPPPAHYLPALPVPNPPPPPPAAPARRYRPVNSSSYPVVGSMLARAAFWLDSSRDICQRARQRVAYLLAAYGLW